MVVTFPNMGNVAIAAKTLCQGLALPYVMPETNNSKTLAVGSYYAPEEICLPFKLILGNFILAARQGADTMWITGSCGPCRFGEYCELAMRTLKKLGYRTDFVVADLSSDVGVKEFIRRIGTVAAASPVHPVEKLRALRLAYQVVELCDRLDAKAYERAGYEVHKGECRRLLHEYKTKVRKTESPEETMEVLQDYGRRLDAVPADKSKNPLNVSIIGEIFTIIDPFSNLYIEEKLMGYGVSSKRMLSPSWWVKNMIGKPFRLGSRDVYKASDPYLKYSVGGHGKECVGEAALAKAQGMDGAIQVFPLGCMPEVVAKSILPVIQEDKGIPIMTLIVDEVTGEAGYITRIEAFLDLLKGRRNQNQKASHPRAALNMRQFPSKGV
ncbi:MAG: 2-hydroxyglutaryl-CoA dehydratase [Oscillospiraceae bacterium]|nr:2-hydroxyglutaryl-CoA dehydratase [Oscillospiraceae bacterium]